MNAHYGGLGRVMQSIRKGTFCLGDVLSGGRFVWGTFCLGDVLSGGRFVWGSGFVQKPLIKTISNKFGSSCQQGCHTTILSLNLLYFKSIDANCKSQLKTDFDADLSIQSSLLVGR